MNYRWIEGWSATDQDWDRVAGVIEARGWAALNKNTTRILMAEDDEGEMHGFHVFQMFPHAEPSYVASDARGTGVAEELADRMLEFIKSVHTRGFMVIADNPIAARLCEARGMTKVESPVYMFIDEKIAEA